MSPEIADRIVQAVGLYCAVGAGFAVLFVAVGIERLDLKARNSGLGFRLLTTPGVVALWPFLAYLWLRARVAR